MCVFYASQKPSSNIFIVDSGQESQTVSNNVLNAQQLAMMGNIIAKAIGTGIHDPCCGKDWEANEDVESGMADKSTV